MSTLRPRVPLTSLWLTLFVVASSGSIMRRGRYGWPAGERYEVKGGEPAYKRPELPLTPAEVAEKRALLRFFLRRGLAAKAVPL